MEMPDATNHMAGIKAPEMLRGRLSVVVMIMTWELEAQKSGDLLNKSRILGAVQNARPYSFDWPPTAYREDSGFSVCRRNNVANSGFLQAACFDLKCLNWL